MCVLVCNTCSIHVNKVYTNNTCIVAILHTYLYIPTDKDECSSVNYPCDSNATCNNTDGSYMCTCNTGYTGSGEICESTFVTLFIMSHYFMDDV